MRAIKLAVWNRQDWTWRLTAIVGLALSIGPPLSAYCWANLAPWSGPSSYISDWHYWAAGHTRFVLEWCLGVLLLWLLMLTRRKWGWLWAGSWALLGAGLVTFFMLDPPWIGRTEDSATALAAALGIVVIVGSQIWLVMTGIPAPHRERRVSGNAPEHGGAALWRRASAAWVVLVLIGGLLALAGVVVVAVHWPWPLWQLRLTVWVPLAAIGLGLVLMLTMVVLLWRELILSGRTWLWWALAWILCFPMLVAAVPEGLKQCSSPEQVVLLLLPLLAVAELWVALKARKLQAEQAD